MTVTHEGDGAPNEFPLCWRMAVGPLAFVVVAGWGGWHQRPEDKGRLTEVFAHLARLVDRAERRIEGLVDPPSGAWVRPVVVTVSELDGLRCDLWDALAARYVPMRLGDEDDWDRIGSWIDDCTIPENRRPSR